MTQINNKLLYSSTENQTTFNNVAQRQPPAPSHNDPTSIASRWAEWNKSFEYSLQPSEIIHDIRKQALLLHIAGPDTQCFFSGREHQHILNKLNEHFYIKNNVP